MFVMALATASVLARSCTPQEISIILFFADSLAPVKASPLRYTNSAYVRQVEYVQINYVCRDICLDSYAHSGQHMAPRSGHDSLIIEQLLMSINRRMKNVPAR